MSWKDQSKQYLATGRMTGVYFLTWAEKDVIELFVG
jgi:hypothetical protein